MITDKCFYSPSRLHLPTLNARAFRDQVCNPWALGTHSNHRKSCCSGLAALAAVVTGGSLHATLTLVASPPWSSLDPLSPACRLEPNPGFKPQCVPYILCTFYHRLPLWYPANSKLWTLSYFLCSLLKSCGNVWPLGVHLEPGEAVRRGGIATNLSRPKYISVVSSALQTLHSELSQWMELRWRKPVPSSTSFDAAVV